MSSQCKICDDIWRRFADPKAQHSINFGSFDESRSSQCPNHTPLVKAFEDHCSQNAEPEDTPSSDVGIGKGYKNHSVQLYESISKLGLFWGLLLAHKPEVQNHPGTGRVLDPDWIDLERVVQWKNLCLSSHGAKCENPLKLPQTTSPAWLVDVERKCIVPGKGCGAYVALSYRWGDDTTSTSTFRLDEHMLETLQKDNALSDPTIADRVPAMIKHAMYLTSVMGERFLWVDALCVVHGGHAGTAEQLNLMSAIYANSIVTIIAADGVARDGLLGLKDVSASRNLEQRVIPFGGAEKLVVRNTDIFSMGSGTEYYRRAWPYQEYTMSARKLLFNNKEIHWECQCSVWHEEMILGAEVDKYIDPRLGVMLAGFPDLGSLSHMISRYNERALTYDEDALSGIAGLLSVLSRSFHGGFLYGLPEMFFDRALGWTPYWNFTNLRRRVPSSRPSTDRVSEKTSLPSWSWIGWDGLVSLRYGEACRINDRQSWMEETFPITHWYTGRAKVESQRKIEPTWFENRDSYKDLNNPLPDGWTRCEAKTPSIGTFRDEPRLYPDNCGPQTFKHRDMPDDDCTEWYYPFPVADISETTPFFTPEQTPYLFCKTKRAHLWAERADYEKRSPLSSGGNILKLRQEPHGEVIGSLQLQTDEQLQSFPEITDEKDAGQWGKGKEVELVAIYRSKRYSKTFNKELQRYDHPLKREEHYVVLWVEWLDGVAYRLACGQVDKDHWERLNLDDVDLVLG